MQGWANNADDNSSRTHPARFWQEISPLDPFSKCQKNKHFTINKKIRIEIQLDLIRWALISCQHADRGNKLNFRYLNLADFFGACSVLPPTCWFHRPPAPSSRWRRRGWRTRGASALASCTWACPSAGRCGLSSALAWPFGPRRRSEKHTRTHHQIMQAWSWTCRFPGFPLGIKNIKWTLMSVGSMPHEVMPFITPTIAVMKWEYLCYLQRYIHPTAYLSSRLPSAFTFTPHH